MKKNTMKSANLSFDGDTISISCNRDELVPGYLHYLLEYHGINEAGKTIKFNDVTCKLVNNKGEYVWQE